MTFRIPDMNPAPGSKVVETESVPARPDPSGATLWERLEMGSVVVHTVLFQGDADTA